MKNERWERRERKQQSKRNRMPKHGMSNFVIQRLQVERAEKVKEERNGNADNPR